MKAQIPLFVEDYNAAIRQTVESLGGYKSVGSSMRPELPADQAGRWLNDCCNDDRRDKLSPQQLGFLRRLARASGVHILMQYENRDAGYADPTPVEPEDEYATLQRMFIESVKVQKALHSQMESIAARMPQRKRS